MVLAFSVDVISELSPSLLSQVRFPLYFDSDGGGNIAHLGHAFAEGTSFANKLESYIFVRIFYLYVQI